MEERFFAIVMLSTVPYYILNLVTIFSYPDTKAILVVIYVALLLVSVGSLYFIWRGKVAALAIHLFAMFILFFFTYYLPESAGPIGGAGYVIQNIIVLLLLMTRGYLKTFMAVVLCGVTIVLFTDVLSFSGKLIYPRLVTDYVVNLVFFAVFMTFFKHHFDAERRQLVKKNDELDRLNKELSEQTAALQRANEEVQAMRDSLQQKVLERTQKLEQENERLLEYSFINAHLVRAPLANIIGLTQIDADNPDFEEIREGILEMDAVVRKIADVLK